MKEHKRRKESVTREELTGPTINHANALPFSISFLDPISAGFPATKPTNLKNKNEPKKTKTKTETLKQKLKKSKIYQ